MTSIPWEEVAKATRAPMPQVLLHWPLLVDGLVRESIDGLRTQAAVAATVAVETGTFAPVRERGSRRYLDKYDTGRLARRLGNTPEDDDDGQLYCGRGFVQLTGKKNYEIYGKRIGVDLIANPDLAMDPTLAAWIMAAYCKDRGVSTAAENEDWVKCRRLVNGGLNGFPEFKNVVDRLLLVLP